MCMDKLVSIMVEGTDIVSAKDDFLPVPFGGVIVAELERLGRRAKQNSRNPL
jgi:hypothetical protein